MVVKNASVLLLFCSQMCKILRLFEGVKCWSMLGMKSLLEQGACFLTLLKEVAVIRLGKKTSTLGGVRGG